MLTFALYRKGELVRRLDIASSIIKIGTVETAHVHIDDPKVSRLHAVIETDDGKISIIDLGSAEGTRVNGTRVNKCSLHLGDRVELGNTTLVLESTGAKPSAESLLPTPERIREVEGPAFAPRKTFGVAAVVLHVDGVRRNEWTDSLELAVPLFEKFPRGIAPPPDFTIGKHDYKLIDDSAPTQTQRCSECMLRPGFSPCGACVGTGSGSRPDLFARCDTCRGEGFVRCVVCNGTTQVVACKVRYVNDEPLHVRRVLTPRIDKSIRPFVEARIEAHAVWPEVLSFDPEPGMAMSAYRGAAAVRATEDFHGFFFGDATAQVLAVRSELTTGLARFAARTYAIPILWVVTASNAHVAYFFDSAAQLVRVEGTS